MDITLARSILREAVEADFTEEIPEDEDQIIEDANYFVKQAEEAWNSGIEYWRKHENVLAILNMSNGLDRERYGTGRDIGEPVQLDKDVFRLVEKENLPIPTDISNGHLEMPRDLTVLHDHDVRRLHSEYNAFMVRAKWLLAVEMSDLANSTHLRDEAYRNAVLDVDRVDVDTGKAKTRDMIDIEAKEDVDYQDWAGKVRQHETAVITWKALVDIYGGNVDRLSREMTFRKDEFERSH